MSTGARPAASRRAGSLGDALFAGACQAAGGFVVLLLYTRISVAGGIMLGLGRALGETMAVTFVIGNANRITTTLFGPGNTIASLVALEFPESPMGSLKLSALLALGFILFVISFAVLALSRWLLRPRSEG